MLSEKRPSLSLWTLCLSRPVLLGCGFLWEDFFKAAGKRISRHSRETPTPNVVSAPSKKSDRNDKADKHSLQNYKGPTEQRAKCCRECVRK